MGKAAQKVKSVRQHRLTLEKRVTLTLCTTVDVDAEIISPATTERERSRNTTMINRALKKQLKADKIANVERQWTTLRQEHDEWNEDCFEISSTCILEDEPLSE